MKHNVYFDGRVQSLGFDGPGGAASVGVIATGTYSFTTTGAEQVIVLSGSLVVRLPGEDWRSVHAPGAYVVPAATTFEVSASADVSYLCRFAPPAGGTPA
jgi:uncharacterized protein YaiE (UPF0345 family)